MNMADPVRRVVTGHDDNAHAVIRSDESFTPQRIPSGDAAFALLWTTAHEAACYRHNANPLAEVQP